MHILISNKQSTDVDRRDYYTGNNDFGLCKNQDTGSTILYNRKVAEASTMSR
jgi:hypothetical protein